MNKRFRRYTIWIPCVLVLYGLTYGALRMKGEITRYENRGEPGGNEIRARLSQFHDLIPEFGRLERVKVKGLNTVFYPLRKVEELMRDSTGT